MSTNCEARDGYRKERELKADGRYVIYYTFFGESGRDRRASGTEQSAPGGGTESAEGDADV